MALHKTSGRWQLGFLLAATSTVLWGSLPIALTVMLRSMDPYTLTWYRLLGAGVILGVILGRRGQLPNLSRLSLRKNTMLLAGSAGLCGNYICYLLGLNHISPSAAQVVIQVAPLLLLLGGLFVFGERFTWMQAAGLATFCGGLALFFHPDLTEIFSGLGSKSIGVIWILVAATCWSIYALLQKQLLNDLTSPQVMFFIYVAIGIALLPMITPAVVLHLNQTQIFILLFCVINSLLAYGSFAEALEHWEASRVGAVLSLSPILTIVFMVIGAKLYPDHLRPENLDYLSLLGAALVVAGSLVTALWGTRT